MTNISISKYGVHGALMLVQLCFSGWHILGSLSIKQGVNPLIFALYREIYASILMLCFVFFRRIRVRIDREDALRFTYLGLCSFLNVVLTIIALQYISPSRYSIMQPCVPVLASIVSFLAGLEGINAMKVVGILSAASGAVLIETYSRKSHFESNISLGVALVSIQCVSMANLLVFQKPLLHKYDSSLVTFLYYAIGSGFTLVLCASQITTFTLNDLLFQQKLLPWIALFYVTVVASLFTYNAIAWAGKYVSPSALTIYSTLQPLFTACLAFLFLNQGVAMVQVYGGSLVIVGLISSTYGRYLEGQHPHLHLSTAEVLTPNTIKTHVLPPHSAIVVHLVI